MAQTNFPERTQSDSVSTALLSLQYHYYTVKKAKIQFYDAYLIKKQGDGHALKGCKVTGNALL